MRGLAKFGVFLEFITRNRGWTSCTLQFDAERPCTATCETCNRSLSAQWEKERPTRGRPLMVPFAKQSKR